MGLYFGFIFLFVILKTASCCRNEESCIMENVFADYNRMARPVLNSSTEVNLNITFFLEALNDIEDRTETMHTIGYFIAEWTDKMIQWDPSAYNGTKVIVLPANKIWLPDLYIDNSATDYFRKTFKDDFYVTVVHTGYVEWEFGGIFSTICDLNPLRFPFDTQTCDIIVGSWAYATKQLSITPILGNAFDSCETNPTWNLTDTNYSAYNYKWYIDIPGDCTNCTSDIAKFSFTWSRQPQYYVLTIVTPTILITVIALCTFLMPPEGGEKASLGITVLLAFSVLQLIINEHTPVNSVITPYLSILVVNVMVLQTISLVGGIISIQLVHTESPDRVPKFIRIIVFRGLAKVFGMRKFVPQENANDADTTNARNGTELEDNGDTGSILNELRFITQRMKEKEKENLIATEWKLLANLIDRLLFCICLCYFVIGVCLYTISV